MRLKKISKENLIVFIVIQVYEKKINLRIHFKLKNNK